MKKIIFMVSAMALCQLTFAQKDPLQLKCPMQGAEIKKSKGDYALDQEDLKILVSSKTDTAIRAAMSGKIYSVGMGEGNKYEIVMYSGDYYIWMLGVTKPLVRKGDSVTAGMPLGYVTPNSEVEFLLFKNETPLDPRKFLNCTNNANTP